MKFCIDCGVEIEVRPQDASRTKRCKKCQIRYHNSEARKREMDRQRAQEYHPQEKGGNYKVIYDPWDSFGLASSFTKGEIQEMLRCRYLANGTKFAHVSGYVYHILDGRLMRAGKAGAQA